MSLSRAKSSRSAQLRTACIFCLSLLALPSAAEAGGTRKLQVTDFDDFDAGETEGVAVEGSGRITVGYASERVEVKASSAFTCLADKKRVFLGTADDATVQTLTLKGRGAKPELKQLAKLPGVVVSAMTVHPRGGDLLVATLPGGEIHRVNKQGKVSSFAKLDVKHIWALQVHKGRLLAATGPNGQLYSLALDGSDPKVVLDVPEKHVFSILSVGENILVGTSPKARLYQVSDESKGILLHEFPGDEARALTLSGRNLLVAVNRFEDRGVGSLKSLTGQLRRSSLTGEKPTKNNLKASVPKAKAAVYRVDLGPKLDVARASESAWEIWLSKSSQYFTDIEAVDKGGTALVSSSRGGKIYRISGRRDRATIADLEERQATGLCRLDDGRLVATAGDGAAAYELASAPAKKAEYVSKVFDAGQPARYGSVVARGTGKLTLWARSGPGKEHDDRWSEWKAVPLKRQSNDLRGQLDIPRRRYFQFKVGLGDTGSVLRDVKIFYAPENLAPLLTSVEFRPPSFAAKDNKEPSREAKIKWKVDARDNDDLSYEVRLRSEGGGDEWIRLNEDPVRGKELELDLATIPDGVYEVAVTASDAPSNGSAQAQTDELVSDPFTVDTGRPGLSRIKAQGSRISGLAVDKASYIHDVAFNIDGGPFHAASAKDGIFDGAEEGFELELPRDLRPGRHRIVLRARDGHGNFVTLPVMVNIRG